MGAVTTSLANEAESIFDDLGYTVSADGTELRAERKWRVVHVTVAEPEDVPDSGRFRCFVTRADDASRTCRRLQQADPGYDWAVMGVREDGSYDVHDRPAPS